MVWISIFPSNVQSNPTRRRGDRFRPMGFIVVLRRAGGAGRACFWTLGDVFYQSILTYARAAKKINSGAGNGQARVLGCRAGDWSGVISVRTSGKGCCFFPGKGRRSGHEWYGLCGFLCSVLRNRRSVRGSPRHRQRDGFWGRRCLRRSLGLHPQRTHQNGCAGGSAPPQRRKAPFARPPLRGRRSKRRLSPRCSTELVRAACGRAARPKALPRRLAGLGGILPEFVLNPHGSDL